MQLSCSLECPESCPDYEDPICGSDGKIYFCHCQLRQVLTHSANTPLTPKTQKTRPTPLPSPTIPSASAQPPPLFDFSMCLLVLQHHTFGSRSKKYHGQTTPPKGKNSFGRFCRSHITKISFAKANCRLGNSTQKIIRIHDGPCSKSCHINLISIAH